MGEQNISFGPAHILSPVMRSSRGKMFVYLAMIAAMCFVVFLLSSAHSSLKQLQTASEKCQQQRDSLSAQLQVVYEHKNRLEKSLQQEKSEHKHTKEDSGKKLQEEESKVQQEKEKEQGLQQELSQLKAKYSELEDEKKKAESSINEQYQSAMAKNVDTVNQLQAQIEELKSERNKLEQDKNTLAWKVQQQSSLCESQNQLLNQKIEELSKKLSIQPEPPAANADRYPADAHSSVNPNPSPAPINSPDKGKTLKKPHVQKKEDEAASNLLKPSLPSEASKVSDEGKKSLPPPDDDQRRQLPVPFAETIDTGKGNEDKNKESNDVPIDLVKDPEAANIQAPGVVGERGDYNNNVGQLEGPQDKGLSNDIKNEHVVLPNINDVNADQIRQMMNKSPDDGNEAVEPHRGPPFQGFHEGPIKENHQANLGRDRQENPPDRHYGDEDDDDPDGDDQDDLMAGMQPNHKGFPGQDFDDQEPNENSLKKEGVVVHPR